ncbi:hypothetical protein Franean1_3290 [Parafrankia sp. EAN1pec]|nr:hypothetical protein Franean1_3290 [Frankia sp. EAN1pec]
MRELDLVNSHFQAARRRPPPASIGDRGGPRGILAARQGAGGALASTRTRAEEQRPRRNARAVGARADSASPGQSLRPTRRRTVPGILIQADVTPRWAGEPGQGFLLSFRAHHDWLRGTPRRPRNPVSLATPT